MIQTDRQAEGSQRKKTSSDIYFIFAAWMTPICPDRHRQSDKQTDSVFSTSIIRKTARKKSFPFSPSQHTLTTTHLPRFFRQFSSSSISINCSSRSSIFCVLISRRRGVCLASRFFVALTVTSSSSFPTFFPFSFLVPVEWDSQPVHNRSSSVGNK